MLKIQPLKSETKTKTKIKQTNKKTQQRNHNKTSEAQKHRSTERGSHLLKLHSSALARLQLKTLFCLFVFSGHTCGMCKFLGQRSNLDLDHCSDNARSLTHWVRPGIEPMSLWVLVRFTTCRATMGTPMLHFFRNENTYAKYLHIGTHHSRLRLDASYMAANFLPHSPCLLVSSSVSQTQGLF